MGHLNAETLARLVDEAPRPDEAEHIEACAACAAELTALREQTDRLGALPELLPPGGDWAVLEARMRSEGLIRDRGLADRLGLARTPAWMRAAAAVLLFLGGTGVGATLATRGPLASGLPGSEQAARFASTTSASDANTAEEAADAVRLAEQRYVEALTRYQELVDEDGPGDRLADPSRFAALEYLVAASQAAVRQAPADPFLNGLLASTLAEREAMVRRIASRQDSWF